MAARDIFQRTFTYRDATDANAVKPLNALQVTVKVASTPPGGGANAVIYGNRTTTDVTPLANPIITGADGLVEFWAPIGDYDIVIHDTIGPARVADKTFGWTSSPSKHAADHESSGSDSLPSILALPPIGTMIPWAGTGDPNASWVLCDGRLLAAATYPTLDAMIGSGGSHIYNGGVVPGGGNFVIPDKRGRMSLGAINMGSAKGARAIVTLDGIGAARGAKGGVSDVTISEAQMPSHVHGPGSGAYFLGTQVTAQVPGPGSGFAAPQNYFTVTGPAGNNQAHTNASPYETDNWIIRVK